VIIPTYMLIARWKFADMKDGGHFGRWFDDEFGLPAYEYTCNHETDPKAKYFTTRGLSTDHWHQLGNDRLNVLAHNDGSVEVLDSSRGLQWLCRRDMRMRQPGGGIVIIEDRGDNVATWCDLFSQSNFKNTYRRVFGSGYYRKTTRRNDLILDHAVFAPFSDDPVVLSELSVKNESTTTKDLILYDYWSVDIRSIMQALIYYDDKRKAFSRSPVLNVLGKLLKVISYALRFAPEHNRDAFSSKFIYFPDYSARSKTIILRPVFRGRRKPPKERPATRNYYPRTLFLTSLDAQPSRTIVSTKQLSNLKGRLDPHEGRLAGKVSRKDSPCLCLGVRVTLKPGEKKTLAFLFGYENEAAIPTLVDNYIQTTQSTTEPLPMLRENSRKWAENVIEFSCGDKKHSWLGRETKWNSYYLRSATLFDEYFQNHLLPQGGAYNYLQGLQGVTRDFMMYTIPMIYIDPSLAREMLEYTMRLMTTDGRLPYCTFGFGMSGGAVVHRSPSDLPLSLLWGLSEYLFATRDFQFLKKKIPFYPKHEGRSSTVQQRIKLAIGFFLNQVGFGDHGLIRIGDGDWNDGISTMVKNRRKFVRNGESMYNSALALYVLPRISTLLEKQGNTDLASKVNSACKQLLEAVMKSWNGKWFYRGWDGSGNPIGDKNIFLEPLTWLLISGKLPENHASQLVNNIYSILDKPSSFGDYLVYPPLRTLLNYLEKGWDVNGGTWFAMNSLLAWGYSRYDSRKGLNTLVKNSMKVHAETFPDVWYGIWSGPDAFNASYASRPGETYYHIATPTTDFPVMNLNLHANFLLALLKIMGVEPTIDGLNFTPSDALKNCELRTPVLRLKIADSEIQGSYSRQATGEFILRLNLPKEWARKKVECYLDDEKARLGPEISDTVEIKVPSNARSFRFRFACCSN
jgi:hypothetical protein